MNNIKENETVLLCIYGTTEKVSKCKALLKENFQQSYEGAIALKDLEKAINLLKSVGNNLMVRLDLIDKSYMRSIADKIRKNNISCNFGLSDPNLHISCNRALIYIPEL